MGHHAPRPDTRVRCSDRQLVGSNRVRPVGFVAGSAWRGRVDARRNRARITEGHRQAGSHGDSCTHHWRQSLTLMNQVFITQYVGLNCCLLRRAGSLDVGVRTFSLSGSACTLCHREGMSMLESQSPVDREPWRIREHKRLLGACQKFQVLLAFLRHLTPNEFLLREIAPTDAGGSLMNGMTLIG